MSLTLVEIPGVRTGFPAMQHCVTSDFSSSGSLETTEGAGDDWRRWGLQGMRSPSFLREKEILSLWCSLTHCVLHMSWHSWNWFPQWDFLSFILLSNVHPSIDGAGVTGKGPGCGHWPQCCLSLPCEKSLDWYSRALKSNSTPITAGKTGHQDAARYFKKIIQLLKCLYSLKNCLPFLLFPQIIF